MEPSTAAHYDMIPRPRPPRLQVLGFFAGATLGVGLAALFVIGGPGSLSSLVQAFSLPNDLKGASFLYTQGGTTTLYHRDLTGFSSVNFGTIFPPLSVSHRGTHFASIDTDAATHEYEVRLDATTVHRSLSVKLDVASSPTGAWLAFTEFPMIERGASTTPIASSTVSVVAKDGTSYRVLGPGYAPFFVSDNLLVFFTANGLVGYDLAAGKITFVDAHTHAPTLPYPAPAHSPDGTLLAFADPATHTVTVDRLGADGTVAPVVSFTNVASPSLFLSNTALYVIDHTQQGTKLSRYTLTKDAAPTEVHGLPAFGMLLNLIP